MQQWLELSTLLYSLRRYIFKYLKAVMCYTRRLASYRQEQRTRTRFHVGVLFHLRFKYADEHGLQEVNCLFMINAITCPQAS
ncbi:unnamed protein product [Musa acuminata subsp. malaccensis]|uniref:(wild Malaysian banana) hypothetical protein n=1 Tax=Musa acuminata subsp. malaccensis TaxID=214687 RepID=A0A804JEJ2_MUSAM|nr:unnamed protein product [Musa acuminata subsp. malaccensis]